MSALPLVSLIIPTYNRGDLLAEAIDSALAQTYPALEIIVVNDGSTDETRHLLARYEGRVQVIEQTNRGVATARNRGLKGARGEYLTFLDDDDLIAPDKIARQVNLLQQRPEIGLVHCGYYRSDADGRWLDKVVTFPDLEPQQQLRLGNFIWTGGVLLRRSCLDEVGNFDEFFSPCEDWDLWLRLAQAGSRFAAVFMPLGTYRQLPDGLSGSLSRIVSGVERILAKIWPQSPSIEADAAAKQQAYGQMYLWLAVRGYGAGQWAEGQQFLLQAAASQPHWRPQPEAVLPLLRGHALDARIPSPPKFVQEMFAHLPPEMAWLRPHHPWLRGYAHLGLALRYQANGNVAEAQTEYAAALHAYPDLPHHPDQVGAFLTHYALSLPVEDPVALAAASLAHLPLSRPTARYILGDIYLGWAFQAYHAEQLRQVPWRVLAAWRHHPSLLKNRGAWAILLKASGRKGGDYAF